MSEIHKVKFVGTATPQTEKATKGQKRNNAGGFSFKITDADRFRRFLTLGTEGSFYKSAQEMTKDNVKFVQKYVKKAGVEAINEIVRVSGGGLAPKNSYALFALAVAFLSEDRHVKEAAKAALPKVARTTDHLFQFIQFVKNTQGWGDAKRKAVSGWYTNKTNDELALQVTKYRNRQGFTHRDALRLSHPVGLDENLANFILGKDFSVEESPEMVQAFLAFQAAKTEKEVLALLDEYKRAPWEFLPTEFHKSAEVWKKLFYNGMPATALLRNVTRFARLGLFDDMKFAGDVAKALTNQDRILKGRVHPINYLNASVVYRQGQIDRKPDRYGYTSERRVKTWTSNNKIQAALDKGYELAFGNLEPAEKRTLVALDVSGSMGANASGLDISCAQFSGAMAQFISKTEPYSMIRGFSSGSRGYRWNRDGDMSGFKDLGISDSDSLGDVMSKVSRQNFGATDCALPMMWALENDVEIDTFIVLTDSETYYGTIHPHEALEKYRKKTGIPAKLVVVAATATEFSIANPNDSGSLDVSGADSSVPKLIADFSAGRV